MPPVLPLIGYALQIIAGAVPTIYSENKLIAWAIVTSGLLLIAFAVVRWLRQKGVLVPILAALLGGAIFVVPILPWSQLAIKAELYQTAEYGVWPLDSNQERALNPKDSFRECGVCPVMIVLPTGTFKMGSQKNERGRNQREEPLHQVGIWAFAIAEYETTVGEFAAFIDETKRDTGSECWTHEANELEKRSDRSWRNPGFFQMGSHPITCISWDDANAYAKWLSDKTGKPYRLLSEAEWEYAARSGTQTKYGFGDNDNDLCLHGNVADIVARKKFSNWTVAACSDGFIYTAPVGSFLPNEFGVHDMIGNVWEWVEDCWNENYEGAPINGSSWRSGDCSGHVNRGGSWYNPPEKVRSASREWDDTITHSDLLGVRVARTLTKPLK